MGLYKPDKGELLVDGIKKFKKALKKFKAGRRKYHMYHSQFFYLTVVLKTMFHLNLMKI